jgi:hypothetical protein
LPGPAPPGAVQDGERLRAAKTLFFDRKYAEAREAWQAVQSQGGGADAEAAGYWVARCSENIGDIERAFGEYGAYLARRPGDRVLAAEARTSRVGLAARLYKAGQRQRLPVLQEALADPEKTVRYYAAFQLASLGPGVGAPAIPLLKRVVAEETDDDLVERRRSISSSSIRAPSPRAWSAMPAGWSQSRRRGSRCGSTRRARRHRRCR